MSWIQNVSKENVRIGFHKSPGDDAVLIQIVDPASFLPKPKHSFKEVYQFDFLDVEEGHDFDEECELSQQQAVELVQILAQALEKNQNVIVHCVMGKCRSGAVAEVGVMMGFKDTKVPRQPNLLVKSKMMKALGWTYDNESTVSPSIKKSL